MESAFSTCGVDSLLNLFSSWSEFRWWVSFDIFRLLLSNMAAFFACVLTGSYFRPLWYIYTCQRWFPPSFLFYPSYPRRFLPSLPFPRECLTLFFPYIHLVSSVGSPPFHSVLVLPCPESVRSWFPPKKDLVGLSCCFSLIVHTATELRHRHGIGMDRQAGMQEAFDFSCSLAFNFLSPPLISATSFSALSQCEFL